ncbi:MAG: hypothetical protein ABSD78_04625 [Acidimicrobiales bacterium]|jgi:hypothetical protein
MWGLAIALPVTAAVATLPAPAGSATRRPGVTAARLTAGVGATGHATTNSIDPYGAGGMNVDAAQSYLASGADGVTPHAVVAYIEGGVNWHDSSSQDLANSMWINWHDTPVPCVGTTIATATMTLNGKTVPCATAYSTDRSDYDVNGDGEITAADWAHDPRVTDANGNGFLDPEDLIAAFSGPGYGSPISRPAGYPNAISGWDFYDNQNDPATTDASYGHSDGQMNVIHTVCPTCLILPVKAGDEAIDSTDDLAKAWMFAYASGAEVIVSVTADLGYSTFASNVLRYLDSKGVIVVESSNDFDSADHQGGMFWGNVLPGNGLVPNTANVTGPTLSKMAGPFWTRSNLTSFGVHNVFSVATHGGSTSESTPTLGAVLALVLSEGQEAVAAHRIAAPLTGAQAVQVLREASTEPSAPAGSKLTWPAAPGEWNEQYGYGMPDVLTALQDVSAGDVPASPEIDTPRWYSLADPTRDKTVTVTGTVSAFRSQPYDWSLQWGLGGDPSKWSTIATGSETGPFSGTFGTLSLSAIPKSFYDATFHLSTTKELETLDQYDVTFRVVTSTIVGSSTLTGEARRVIDAFHDPTALAGFPMSIGSSGESQPALVDLQGTGVLDIVFGTADGAIDAIDPRTGHELPGWPAHTGPIQGIPVPPGVVQGDQPVVSDVAVGDLNGTGQLSVAATSEDGYVYVFDPEGRLEPGWPHVMAAGVVKPPIPRPALANERRPMQGAVAPPVLVALEGGKQLDIVQAGWDGEIHAWYPDGKSLPGWPVRVTLTKKEESLPPGYTLEADHKLDTPPAVAHFSSTGPPDLVIRSQYTELGSGIGGLQVLPYGFVFAYTAGGKLVPGWPVRLQGTLEYYGSAQEFITEGTDAPAVADVLGTRDGNDSHDDVAVGPVWTPDSLVDSAGKVVGSYGSDGDVLAALLKVVGHPSEAIFGPLPPTTPMPFTGSGAFGDLGGHLTFAIPTIGAEHLAAALVYPGSGRPINQLAAVWPALAAARKGTASDELAGFPTAEQGQAFLSSPMYAPVSAGSANDVVIGGDSGAVDARTATGAEASGFPKFTGGWTLYAPSAGDLFGNGHDDLVAVTREGWLFAWSTSGSAPAAGSWWRALHDEWNSDNLGTDSRPPGVVREGNLSGRTLSFLAPGSHWYDGQATSYQLVEVASNGKIGSVQTIHADQAAGATVRLAVASGSVAVIVRAVSSDGLVSNSEKCTASGEVTVAWPN